MNKEIVLFFVGQSGAGKDTQIRMLLKDFREKGIRHLYLSMGDEVRKRAKKSTSGNYFAKHMTDINAQGKLQPSVLPIYFYLKKIEKAYQHGMMIIINGSPRRKEELMLWKSLMDTGYLPSSATIIHVDTPDDECLCRINKRKKRADTLNDAVIKTKMAWFKPVRIFLSEPLPDRFRLVTIDGLLHRKGAYQEIKRNIGLY